MKSDGPKSGEHRRRAPAGITSDPVHLVCTNGHQVTVLWGRPVPLCCPACPLGIPCEMPLRPLRQTAKTR